MCGEVGVGLGVMGVFSGFPGLMTEEEVGTVGVGVGVVGFLA